MRPPGFESEWETGPPETSRAARPPADLCLGAAPLAGAGVAPDMLALRDEHGTQRDVTYMVVIFAVVVFLLIHHP